MAFTSTVFEDGNISVERNHGGDIVILVDGLRPIRLSQVENLVRFIRGNREIFGSREGSAALDADLPGSSR